MLLETAIPESIDFCKVDELKSKRCVTRWVEVFRDEITAIVTDDGFNVVSTVCPHFGGEFKYNEQTGELVCKWHGFKFDGKDGKCRWPQSRLELRRYAFKIENDWVKVLRP